LHRDEEGGPLVHELIVGLFGARPGVQVVVNRFWTRTRGQRRPLPLDQQPTRHQTPHSGGDWARRLHLVALVQLPLVLPLLHLERLMSRLSRLQDYGLRTFLLRRRSIRIAVKCEVLLQCS